MRSEISVVLLAAGLGTRMKSKHAKVLHRAGGMTLVEHAVRTATALAAAERVHVVVGHQAEQVQAALEEFPVRFVRQVEQKGTGDAVAACRQALQGQEGWVLVLYADCPLLSVETLQRLVERQTQGKAAATLITTRLEDPTGYGRIVKDAQGVVEAIVEQKAATAEQLEILEINSGIYCFQAALLWKYIGEIRPDNPAHEYYLTDMVEILRRAGHPVNTLLVEDSAELLGINTRVELATADRVFRERKVRELMLAGVTIEKPETVTVDAGVEIGRDTVVGPFAQILGKTRIGEGCRIGACSIVEDSVLANDVLVGPFTIVGTSEVETGAQVGPYSRLRLANHVCAGAHVGNFVELKKTRIGAGSKAMHLAYLGDAQIGAGVNVGAGTITCNYDGSKKNTTVVGDRAFVGSNSTLVAPVEVGEGSYVAAGSVVTENVPKDALGLGRARQINKAGWAKKRRDSKA
jgi:bifunctional UDP-N-acetylglucosamine pyrophosphorylase / glucosamine-1-phosphate N-acetyltransferase